MTSHGRDVRPGIALHSRGLLAVTVLAGLDPDATAMLAAGLLTRTERCAVVWIDPTTAEHGHLTWRVDDSDGRHATGRSDIVDDCLPCALRAVVLHRLIELRDAGTCDAVVVRLHPAVEVEAIVASLCAGLPADLARIDTIACVLDATTWLADLAGDDDLHSRGLAIGPHDDRSVSMLLGSQLDVADRIVLLTSGTGLQPLPAEQWTALRALAPDARRFVPPTVLDVPAGQLLRTGAHHPRCLHPLAERGLLDWNQTGPDDRPGAS